MMDINDTRNHIMNTSTATSSCVKTKSTFRHKVGAFLAEIRHILDLTGRAYLHGAVPL
jgi:hypothetical protein